MTWDYTAQKVKELELTETLRKNLELLGMPRNESNIGAQLLFGAFVQISPPKEEIFSLPKEGIISAQLVTISNFGGRGGGKSRKLGNIRLNINKLMEEFAAGVFTSAGVAAAPWSFPLAALLLWRSFQKVTEIDLTENEVIVLFILHRLKDSNKQVVQNLDSILDSVNEQLKKYQRSLLSESDVSHSIDILVKIGAIRRNDSGTLIVCEQIRVRY